MANTKPNATQVKYKNETVYSALDRAETNITTNTNNSVRRKDYTELRAYTGPATIIDITDAGIAGRFAYDPSDTASADNGGTIIVGNNNKRWKRLYSGTVNVQWFGFNGLAIQAALNAAASDGVYDVLIPAGNYSASAEIVIPPFVNLHGVGHKSRIIAAFTPARGLLVLTAGTGVTGNIAGRYVRDICLIGNGSGVGLGTDIRADETVQRYLYGFRFENVFVESFDEGFKFQALWHSTLDQCTASTCLTGLLFWGQCVSVHITGSHFRRDALARGNVFGIRVMPRIYAWSEDQVKGSRSEAIIIDGETMCIGSDFGIYIDSVLDMHISNVDLDYIGKYGVVCIEADGGFTLSDSWIAADRLYDSQFIGVVFPESSTPQGYKRISGSAINSENASPTNNNIGISVSRWGVVVENCNIVNGAMSVYASGLSEKGLLIRDSVLSSQLYITGCHGISVTGSRLSGLVMALIPAGAYNHFRDNSGVPSTHGVGEVPVSGGGTAGELQIANPYSGGRYRLLKLYQDVASTNDTLAVSPGGLINITRPVAVNFAIPSPVEWILT